MNDFLTDCALRFLGNRPISFYVVCMVFAAIGAYIITRIRAKKSSISKPGNPDKFSLIFMIVDNIKDVGFALSVSFIAFRFSNHFIESEGLAYVYAFILGLCFNAVVWGITQIEKNFSKKIKEKASNLGK